MRRKFPIVATAVIGLVLILVIFVHATPINLEPGKIWIIYVPVLNVDTVRATPVELGKWYVFEWSGFVTLDGLLETSGSRYYEWSGLADPGVSPWIFTAPSEGMFFTVTDMETDADSFIIMDFDILVGTTPDTGPEDSHEPCNWDPQKCMDSDFSHGVFFLGTGKHLITIENKDPRGVTGRGAFRLDTASDPIEVDID